MRLLQGKIKEKKLKPIKIRYKTGAWSKYATLVRSASEGAITMPILKQIKKKKPKD